MPISLLPEELKQKEEATKQAIAARAGSPKFDLHLPEDGQTGSIDGQNGVARAVDDPWMKVEAANGVVHKPAVFAPVQKNAPTSVPAPVVRSRKAFAWNVLLAFVGCGIILVGGFMGLRYWGDSVQNEFMRVDAESSRVRQELAALSIPTAEQLTSLNDLNKYFSDNKSSRETWQKVFSLVTAYPTSNLSFTGFMKNSAEQLQLNAQITDLAEAEKLKAALLQDNASVVADFDETTRTALAGNPTVSATAPLAIQLNISLKPIEAPVVTQ